MDSFLVTFSVVTLAITTVTLSLALTRQAKSTRPPTINTGSGAQINLGVVARDMIQGRRVADKNGRRRTSNTNLQVCEDILANLAQADRALDFGIEVMRAARDGRFRGDPVEVFSATLEELDLLIERAAFIGRLGSKGLYLHLMTGAELDELFHAHVEKSQEATNRKNVMD